MRPYNAASSAAQPVAMNGALQRSQRSVMGHDYSMDEGKRRSLLFTAAAASWQGLIHFT